MKTIIEDGIKYKKIEFGLTDKQFAKEFGMSVEEVQNSTEEAMILTPGVIEINGEYYEELDGE